MEEKLNIDLEEDTTCPICGKHRYWLKFYCDEVINVCSDCGYFEKI